MKNLKYNLKKYLNKRDKKEIVDYKWILKIIVIAFLISMLFSFLSETIIPSVNVIIGILILIIFILIGVVFDMIGVAVTTAEEAPFHSMSSNKIRGAKTAVNMKKNADKTSSFCNDVVGDICGIVSGSAGAIIATSLSANFGFNSFITVLVVTGFISALTIGGKAFGKSIAVNKSNYILYEFAKVVTDLSFRKK